MPDNQMWGIHMPSSLELRPVQNGFIAIGWPKLGNLSVVPPDREAFKKILIEEYPEFSSGAVPVHAGTLFKFVNEIKLGDWIIYPSKPDKMVNLGRVVGEYFFEDRTDPNFPNRRNVNWSLSLPRAQFSQSALNEIGSAVTLFKVQTHFEEFFAALEGKKIVEETVDAEVFQAASEATEESTADFILKSLKTKLNPTQFEFFVAHLLECMGYHCRVTQASGDGGVDVIAHKDELGFEPPIVKVQCKQTFGTVGEPLVAQLSGHVHGGREYGLFVTLGDYSPQAKQFERNHQNLRLINGATLIDLIFSHYDAFEPRYQVLLPLKKVYIPSTTADSL